MAERPLRPALGAMAERPLQAALIVEPCRNVLPDDHLVITINVNQVEAIDKIVPPGEADELPSMWIKGLQQKGQNP